MSTFKLAFSCGRPSLFCVECRPKCHSLHIVRVVKVCSLSKAKTVNNVFLSFFVIDVCVILCWQKQ